MCFMMFPPFEVTDDESVSGRAGTSDPFEFPDVVVRIVALDAHRSWHAESTYRVQKTFDSH